eukprot:TRINITY_DN67257_c0_g1_i3.p1 TRINITY_DN67257_c0_g1~~TRINITY_DN67257_c0_g1_i3.p1  ORF type:complete len:467 (-),score=15.67 TRINITY_DN67257_c0_g1_i3:2-1375(-)
MSVMPFPYLVSSWPKQISLGTTFTCRALQPGMPRPPMMSSPTATEKQSLSEASIQAIHQTNEEKKAAGILGLAGFLRASRRLVVVWSPRYFSRLWCTYELATWCHLHGSDVSRVCFLPMVSCSLLWQTAAACVAHEVVKVIIRMTLMRHASDVDEGTLRQPESWLLISASGGLLVLPILFKPFSMVQELKMLQKQVQDFRIRDSKCFCCTNDHRNPDTGERMACDRKLVYTTLHGWSVGEAGSATSFEGALDRFDEVVRHGLSKLLAQSTNKALTCLTYKECVYVAIPIAWSGLDYACMLYHDGRYLDAARWLLEYSTLPLFVWPLSLVLALACASRMEGVTRCIPLPRLKALLCSSAVGMAFLCTFVFLWLPGPVVTELNKNSGPGLRDLPLVVRYACLAMLTTFVIRSPSSIEWWRLHDAAQTSRVVPNDACHLGTVSTGTDWTADTADTADTAT